MKQNKWNRSIIWCLIMIIVIGTVGCQKGEDAKNSSGKNVDKKNNMGRYMEEEVALPKELKQAYSCIAVNEKGEIELYSLSAGENGKAIVKKHTMQKDKTFVTEECDWITGYTSINNCNEFQVIYGKDGNLYAHLDIYREKGSEAVVLKASEDLKKSEVLSISYLKKPMKDRQNMLPRIDEISVLTDGTILADNHFSDGISLLSSKNGKLVGTLPAGVSETWRNHPFYVEGNQVVTVNSDKSGFTVYNAETKEEERRIDYKLISNSYAFTLRPDGGFYVADSDGIHKRAKDGTMWETLVDGDLNSLSLPNRVIEKLIVYQDEKEEYFTFGNSGDGVTEFMRYYYDSKVTAVPEKEISVYSLEENSTLRQASVLYQKKHPDTKINYQVAMETDGGNINDHIKTLNTELLAGTGADILLLDNLPMDTYIEKGVLADVSELIADIEQKEALFPNIAAVYKKNGTQYGMPIRFGVPIMVGEKESLDAMKSSARASAYTQSLGKVKLFNSITYKKLAELFMAVEWNRLVDVNHTIREKDLVQYLNDLNSIAKNVKATEEGEDAYGSMGVNTGYVDKTSLVFSIPLSSVIFGMKSKIGMEYTTDLYTAALPIAAGTQKNLKLSSFNGIFIPNGIAALNKKGKNMESAKEFYQYLFTEEIQDVIVYDGYPVNQKSCEKWLDTEYDGYGFSLQDDSGNSMEGGWPSKEERINLKKILDSLTTPLENDRVLKDIIMEETLPFLKGEKTAEEAAEFIKNKANMYMAE